jgi:hypothetical protein
MTGAMIVIPTELIDELNSADGEIYIADPSERVRAQYRRAIYAAKERRLVPEGFQLWHTGRDHGDMVIRLLKRHALPPGIVQPPRAPEAAQVRVAETRVKRPTIDLGPALASLKVSKALLPRCRSILQALTDEAIRRGYEVGVGVEKSSLVIVASREHLPFRLFEEQDTAAAPPPTSAELRRYRWQLPPSTIKVPTGRLALRLEHDYRNRTWADRSRWRLEDRLTEVIDHVDSLARAEIERQREAHEQGLRDLEAWEAGAAAARRAYVAALNRRRMRNQAARSARARALRAFASRIRDAGATEANHEMAAQMVEWAAAILVEAARMDPLSSPADLRSIEPEQIRTSDLSSFMPHGMSIYSRPVVPPAEQLGPHSRPRDIGQPELHGTIVPSCRAQGPLSETTYARLRRRACSRKAFRMGLPIARTAASYPG